jgi:hypothetical protein
LEKKKKKAEQGLPGNKGGEGGGIGWRNGPNNVYTYE